MKFQLFSLVLVLGGLAVSACGSTKEPAPVWNVEKSSTAGDYQAVFSPNPDPPIVGDNVLLVQFTDPGAVDTVTVGAWMPAHGHGTPEDPVVAETTDGYEVTKLYYIMPGHWELTVDVDGSAGTDAFVLGFDVQ